MVKETPKPYNARHMMPNITRSQKDGPREVGLAKVVEHSINSVIPDIKLFWNHTKKRWVVAQVFKNPGGLLLPGFGSVPEATRPNALYTIETKEGEYRSPSEWDVRQAIKIGKFGREALSKGADWLVDQVELGEKAQRDQGNEKLRKHVAAIAPEMKAAFRGDTHHGRRSSR